MISLGKAVAIAALQCCWLPNTARLTAQGPSAYPQSRDQSKHNAGPEKPLSWRLSDGRDFLTAVRDSGLTVAAPGSTVASSRQGHIYILDGPNSRVVELDYQGKWIRSFGRKGTGPGELAQPSDIGVADNGTIAVHDFSRAGLVLFNESGVFMRVLQLNEWLMPGFSSLGGQWAVGLRGKLPGDSTYYRLALVDASGAKQEIARFVGPSAKRVELSHCKVTIGSLPPLFSANLIFASNQKVLVYSADESYSFWIRHSDGQRIRVTRPWSSWRPSDAMVRVEVGDTFWVRSSAGTCKTPAVQFARARGISARVQAVRRIAVSPAGEIWIERNDRRLPFRRIDIFNTDGEYLGTLPRNAPFPVGFINNNTIIVAEDDLLADTRLIVYDLVRTRVLP